VFQRLDALLRFLLECMDNSDFIRKLDRIHDAKRISPMRERDLQRTPDPKPCSGLTMSAFPPSAATVNAVSKIASAFAGKDSKSLRPP
jgi:hypothetical protein